MDSTNENASLKIQNLDEGYAIFEREFVNLNTSKIKDIISNSNYVKSYLGTPFHSIPNLFIAIPELKDIVLPNLKKNTTEFGEGYRCISSTYYDKPKGSKWQLDFHQDIKVKVKNIPLDYDFFSCDKKADYYHVCPPVDVLENILVIRIHLDDCKIVNGALRIIPGSHKEGFIDVNKYEIRRVVNVELREGDIIQMSPLLLHSAGVNKTNDRRRVLHLEFSNLNLPWYEEHV